MTSQEEFLVMLLDGPELDSNSKAFLLQQFIQEEGPLSEECAAKVRELLHEIPSNQTRSTRLAGD